MNNPADGLFEGCMFLVLIIVQLVLLLIFPTSNIFTWTPSIIILFISGIVAVISVISKYFESKEDAKIAAKRAKELPELMLKNELARKEWAAQRKEEKREETLVLRKSLLLKKRAKDVTERRMIQREVNLLIRKKKGRH